MSKDIINERLRQLIEQLQLKLRAVNRIIDKHHMIK